MNAERERKPPGCLAEDVYASTATAQLAMISYETGIKVDWDAKSERVLNNPAASELLKRRYRKPYKHPFVG